MDSLAHRPNPPAERPSLLRSPATAWALLFTALLMAAVASTRLQASTDDAQVQQTVAQQLHALAAEDASSAFALADHGLRTQFGSPQAFLDTVRDEYPMVVDAETVLFLKPHSDGSMALQKVRLTDRAGAAWLVTYLLQRDDGRWLISGTLVEPDGIRIIA